MGKSGRAGGVYSNNGVVVSSLRGISCAEFVGHGTRTFLALRGQPPPKGECLSAISCEKTEVAG